ncbi:single-stranded-DNA-specific exonuclease RecJ [uncultured Amaricoccus sp.]|uniref:single-stranded-DNA-specific exonuclease RecJ n=1 Tax=uncultured Amaricoccus sp. TaxID=339341 RepID=UPI002629A883|nr:single-stranded-DNA-specific exonuclease RecJ [uncultured Amaricoccus sp.]
MLDSPAFLNVEASVTGRRWVGPEPEQVRLGAAIAQAAGLPELVGRILAGRGVAPEEAAAYLAPALRDLLPDPSRLRDMDRAAARFLAAVRRGERIAVFADYDVDGGASAALLITWLRALGREATLYVPDRIEEGYGPNLPAMQALGATHDLIVCVDCGTLSHAPVAAAGCDVLVLDHHLGAETLPPAFAVVNPNRQDEDGGLGHLCAAAVVFLMLVAVNRLMRAEGETEGETGPDLLGLLDLVALATVADVAPLTGLNRALVRQGLAVMARGARPGIAALAAVAGMTGPPSPYGLGFVLGPRVNAGGRVGAADLGARLLASADPHEAAALAERLDRLNGERREIEAAVRAAAEAQAAARPAGPIVWAAGEGWHPGVVGIVAARLKEAFGRPAVVIGLDRREGKGSGRSVPGVDLGAGIARLAREGLILRGGGHRMAAGLTLAPEQVAPAMARLGEILAPQQAAAPIGRALRLEGVLGPGAATPELAERIAAAGPYGAGSPAPRLAVAGARITGVRRIGESHLALALADGSGRLEAVAFRAFEGPLGPFLLAKGGAGAHLAGRLERDEWQGRVRVKLHVEDAAPAA